MTQISEDSGNIVREPMATQVGRAEGGPSMSLAVDRDQPAIHGELACQRRKIHPVSQTAMQKHDHRPVCPACFRDKQSSISRPDSLACVKQAASRPSDMVQYLRDTVTAYCSRLSQQRIDC